jgi:5-methylcytosine-specific restriction endonuclease McrA
MTAPSIRCSYCRKEQTPDFRVIPRNEISDRKRARFESIGGSFPVCRRCRMLVELGRSPVAKSVLETIYGSLVEKDQHKFTIAPPSDLRALRQLADEVDTAITSLLSQEMELARRIDELPSLPKKIANARKTHCLGMVARLNKCFDRVRSINAYLAGHIAIEYGEARRAANAAVRPEWVRRNVFLSGGGKCQYCESTENLSVDHVLPVFRGGSSDFDNLQLLCRRCNSRKGAIERALRL